jgi:hypothetical protein
VSFNLRDRIIVVALALVAIGAVLLLSGCGGDPRQGGIPGQPCPPVGADLIALGHTLTWFGGIALVLGFAVRIAFLVAFLNPLAAVLARIPGVTGIATLVAEAGAIALVSGLAFTWLGHHMWVLIAAVVAALVAWGMHRRTLLLRWYRAWTHHEADVKAKA